MKVFFIENNNVLNVILNGRPYTINTTHPNYNKILENLGNDMEEADWKLLLDIPQSVNNYMGVAATSTNSGVQVRGNSVFYKNHEVHGSIVNKILEFMNRGLPYQYLTNFLDNLYQNPSMKAVERLYDFLSHNGMAITDDGCFVGYKGVETNYNSKHRDAKTGLPLSYKIGSIVEMPRNKVDDNENNACSHGIHVGTFEYASGFAPLVLLVKVNPRDAVTVPLAEINKLRCCRLEVLSVCKGVLDDPFYGTYNESDDYDEVDDDDDDDDSSYDDYEDEDDDYTGHF